MLRELQVEDVLQRLREPSIESHKNYLAMYSSWYGGVIRDPRWMMLPIDDHMVHRGDGVFEAIKCVQGKIYALDRHLERLVRSAQLIDLQLPMTLPELREICLETTRLGGAADALLRLYVSRGPGSFSPNPYESVGAQVYLVITRFNGLPEDKYTQGVACRFSLVPVKPGLFATVKSCNYLPNVLMAKEAIDAGVQFAIARDETGHIAEGPTENIAIVTQSGEFLAPGFERTLRGVTLVRAMELACAQLLPSGRVTAVAQRPLTEQDVMRAREVLLFSTTMDCLPVIRFDGQAIGQGPGPVFQEILAALRQDMNDGPLAVPVARK